MHPASTQWKSIESVREGLDYGVFTGLADRLGLSLQELAATMGLPRRTITRRRQSGRLSPSESDHVWQVERLVEHAMRVLGSEESARGWMRSELRGLDYRTPLSLVDTSAGLEAAHDVLHRLEYGVFG